MVGLWRKVVDLVRMVYAIYIYSIYVNAGRLHLNLNSKVNHAIHNAQTNELLITSPFSIQITSPRPINPSSILDDTS